MECEGIVEVRDRELYYQCLERREGRVERREEGRGRREEGWGEG